MSNNPPDTEPTEAPARFEPIECRAVLPVAGDIVAKGKMTLTPPGGKRPEKPTFTEVRLDAERMRSSNDRSGAVHTSVGAEWIVRGYVLRYHSRGLRGSFRKLLPQTFSTVPDALDGLARCWEIPDEALEHPRSYRIRMGLGGPPEEAEAAEREVAEEASE